MRRNNIRIAIQKEGRLRNSSLNFLESFGLRFSRKNGGTLLAPCENADAEILFVRHSDIPRYVESGTADFAIVGENVLFENSYNVKTVKKLDFGACRLMIAVPITSLVRDAKELEGERIATTYPNSLRAFLRQRKINAAVVEIRGAVEVSPALGLADAICDLTQTGNTLKENNLRPIETLFDSTAALIESRFENRRKSDFICQFLTFVL